MRRALVLLSVVLLPVLAPSAAAEAACTPTDRLPHTMVCAEATAAVSAEEPGVHAYALVTYKAPGLWPTLGSPVPGVRAWVNVTEDGVSGKRCALVYYPVGVSLVMGPSYTVPCDGLTTLPPIQPPSVFWVFDSIEGLTGCDVRRLPIRCEI